MHVGAVSVLEGAPFFDADGRFRIDEVRDLVLSRLPLHAPLPAPAHVRAVRAGPADLGRRRSLRHHVSRPAHRAAAARDRGSSSSRSTTRVQEELLDRERPLWEIWFVEGLEGGNVGAPPEDAPRARSTACRASTSRRCCSTCSPTTSTPVVPEWTPKPAPSPSQLLLDTLRERITEPAEIVRSIRSLLRGPRHAIERVARARAVDEHDGDARRDRAAHVDQRAHRPAPPPLGRADPARRRQGDPRAGSAARSTTSCSPGCRAGCAACSSHRADDTEDLHLRVLCPVSVRADDQQRRARQQGLGDVREPAGRQPARGRAARTRSPRRRPTSRNGARRSAPRCCSA